MSFQHGSCDAVDLVAAANVAELVLGAELLGQRSKPVLAAREQDGTPATCRERAGDRLPDPPRAARDDGDALVLYRQTLTSRLAERLRPAASVAAPLNMCRPAATRRVPHDPVYTPSAPRRSMSSCFPSTKKRTERMGFVELATTTSPAVLDTH